MCRRRYITHRRHARFIHFKTKKGITSLLIEFPRKTDVSLLTRRTTTARVRVPARRRVRRIPRSRVVIRRSIIVRVVIRTVRVRVCVAESNHIRPSVSPSNRKYLFDTVIQSQSIERTVIRRTGVRVGSTRGGVAVSLAVRSASHAAFCRSYGARACADRSIGRVPGCVERAGSDVSFGRLNPNMTVHNSSC